jgi:Na+/melibiose symporter-like transporter
LQGLQIAFLSGPILFVILGGVCVLGWKLDADRHAGVRAKLDARDAALDVAPVRPAGPPPNVVLEPERLN